MISRQNPDNSQILEKLLELRIRNNLKKCVLYKWCFQINWGPITILDKCFTVCESSLLVLMMRKRNFKSNLPEDSLIQKVDIQSEYL